MAKSVQDKLSAFGIDAICALTAEVTPQRTIAAQIGVSWETMMAWIDADPSRIERYARAREAQADKMAEDILALADISRIGTKTTTKPDGSVETVTSDMVDRARLQIDARKWLAAKMAPKKYGERLELAGELALKKSAADMTDDELLAIATGRKQDKSASKVPENAGLDQSQA